MESFVNRKIIESIESKKKLIGISKDIALMSKLIVNSFKNGGKLILFGNGGSAADAQHIATEFVNLLDCKKNRSSLNALALTTNCSILTSISNDLGFENLFSRQVEGLVNPNDVVVGISTSGNSVNVLNGLTKAKEKGAVVIGLTGNRPSRMDNIGLDLIIKAPSDNVNRIQEMHITIGHVVCSAVEKELFGIE